MKKSLFYLTTAVVLLAINFVACHPDVWILPMDVSLDPASITLAPGETAELTPTIFPDEATIKTVTWSSSNPDVATVNDGVVTAITEGKAFITVTTKSGQKMATCHLTVGYFVSGVLLDHSVVLLTVGKSQKLTATVMPDNAPDHSVKWKSSNPDVAEVVDGVVTAKAPGTATITVTTEVGGRTATCDVRVLSEKYISMTSLQSASGVFLMISGSGEMHINWGDGSPVETHTLSASIENYYHYYSGSPPYVITIEGDDMTYLYCSANQLTGLDVRRITTLTTLNCSNNQLMVLDVSKHDALEELNCGSNQFSSLDLSHNSFLRQLWCTRSQLRELDLSNNTWLSWLVIHSNELTALDLSNNTRLIALYCEENQLSASALDSLFDSLHSNEVPFL